RRLDLVHRDRDDDRRPAADLAGEGDAARVRRTGAAARRLGRLLPGLGATRLDAGDLDDLTRDLRAARVPRRNHRRRRPDLALVGHLAPARDRSRRDTARAVGLPRGRALCQEARKAEAVRMIRVAGTRADFERCAEIYNAVEPDRVLTTDEAAS